MWLFAYNPYKIIINIYDYSLYCLYVNAWDDIPTLIRH